jgi:mannose-6-phosphate isomerase-like protein (cupin superfamily)
MAIKINGDIVIDDSENLIISGYGDFNGTSYVRLPSGTTAQRPAAGAGRLRYNTSRGLFEIHDGAEWAYIGETKSNGTIHINNTTTDESYTFLSGQNGMSIGPVTINAGVSITVPAGQRWLIL